MQQKRNRILDIHAAEKIAVRCKISGRLNARIDAQGLYVFCRQCNTQHLLTNEVIAKLQHDGDRVVYI